MTPASAFRPAPARRRVPAFLAAVVLATGGLVALTATPASAAPGAPDITSPANGSLVDSTTTSATANVAGTINWGGAPNGGTVHVVNTTHAGLDCPAISLPSYTEEAWACDVGLGLGENVIVVHGDDGDPDGVGPTSSITIWYGGTGDASLVTPADETLFAEGDIVHYSGAGPAGGTVEVLHNDGGPSPDDYPVLCTASVDAAGSWSCDLPTPPAGVVVMGVRGTDMQGTVSYDLNAEHLIYVSPLPPVVGYTMRTAGFDVAATSSVTAELRVDVYAVDATNAGDYLWGDVVASCPRTIGSTSCSVSGLAPGIWNVYTTATADEIGDEKRDDFVYIPATPAIAAQAIAANRVRVTTTSAPGTSVEVRDQATGTLVCTVAGTGAPRDCLTGAAAGTQRYTAQARSVGFVADPGPSAVPAQSSYDGLSAIATSATVAVVAPAPPAPPASAANTTQREELVSTIVKAFEPTITTPPVVVPGSTVTVKGKADLVSRAPAPKADPTDGALDPAIAAQLAAAARDLLRVMVELHSDPVELGSAPVADDGTFELVTAIPADAPPGAHEIVAILTGEGIEPIEVRQAVTISAPALTAEEPLAAEGGTDGGAGGASDAAFDRMQPAGANMLSAIATLGSILGSPDVLIAAGVLALALLLLVALPSQLLDAALANSPGRLGRALRRLDGIRDRFDEGVHRVLRTPLALSAVAAVLLSLVYCFADPAFGFELSSLRMLLALAIAFLVISWGAGRLTGLIARRLWGVETEFEVQLSAIPLAVIGVVISRLLDFSPGFFLGFAIGVQLLAAGRRARLGATVTSFAVILVLAVLAWLGYSALAGLAIGDFGGALARDTLSAIVVEGLTAAAIAVLPLTFLEGRELWETSKRAWLLVFLLVEFAFCLLVLPTAMEETEVADLIVWTIVLLVYAALAFGAWWWISRRPAAAEPEAAEDHPRRQVDHPAG